MPCDCLHHQVLAKPFIVRGTILDNILLGRPLVQARLDTTLTQCARACWLMNAGLGGPL